MPSESRHDRGRGQARAAPSRSARLRFTESDLTQFSAASHDANPVHLDAGHARRTAYGQPVVFGVLAVLRCLDHFEPDGRISRLEAEFSHPLFVDVDYEVRVRDSRPDQIVVHVCEGDLELVELRVCLREPTGLGPLPRATQAAPSLLLGGATPRDVPKEYDDSELLAKPMVNGEYVAGTAATRGAQGVAGAVGSSQSDVLMLCSYLVGMELPGQRSLLYKLRLDFEQGDVPAGAHLRYEARTLHYEPSYGLLQIDLQVRRLGSLVASGTIGAFVRKRLGQADLSSVATQLTAPRGCLRGKVALVIGGSRGLGATVVQALALQGSDVILSFRSSRIAAETLQSQLRDAPGTVTLRQGDAGDPTWCDETRAWLLERYGGLDLLICNACTPPLAFGESETGLARGEGYVEQNLALVAVPIRAFLDLLEARHGTLAVVSSSMVESKTQQWPQYQRLKCAVEAAVQTASSRCPQTSFLVLRPAALLTEMSNTPTRSLGAIEPEIVAARLVDALAAEARPGRVEVLTDFTALQSGARTVDRTVEVTGEAPKIALAATFTAKPLLAVVDFWSAELGWGVASEVASYNRLHQELLDPQSAVCRNRSGLNVLLLRFGDWLRELPDTDLNGVEIFLDKALDDLIEALKQYCRRPHCHTLLILCPESAAHAEPPSWHELMGRLGQRLVAAAAPLSGLDAVWAADYHARYELSPLILDAVAEQIGHIPFTLPYYAFLGTLIARRFHSLRSRPYKVIVVDCDNTLWRGVCGEVGAAGVVLDEAARKLQEFLVEQKQRGMLLCLCSKNNAEDVERVFETRFDMPLRRDDFVENRINWEPKSENVRSLGASLNLGLDSFVFLDDSAIECAELEAVCRQVLTLQVPVDGGELARLLRHTWIFDHFETTEEDAKRTELYRADQQRRQLEAASGSLRAFLARLDLTLEIAPASRPDFPRIAQLTQRTNQFNFTAIRRTERDLETLLDPAEDPSVRKEGRYECRVIRVRDRFGDYGLVGLIVFAQQGDALAVESFMLSCRVLGRGVEHGVMASLGALARERSIPTVKVAFRETSSNQPAKLFLEEMVRSAAGKPHQDAEWWFPAEALALIQYQPQDTPDDDPAGSGPVSPKAREDVHSPARGAARSWHRIAFELSDPHALATQVRRHGLVNAKAGRSLRSRAVGFDSKREARHAPLIEKLRALFADTLDLDHDAVDPDAQLETYVTDSLDNVMLTVELKKRYPNIPITILFEHRSLASIAAYLLEEPGAAAIGQSPPEAVALDLSAFPSIASADRERTSPSDKDLVPRQPTRGDIAIIGINGRYPQAPSIAEFWDNLVAGRSCISEVPRDRWDVDAFFDVERKASTGYCKLGGFIDDVARFDAGFFRIAPREAELMDPQQRLFLEVVWGLLEDAGYTRETIDRDTGVFVGSNANDYALYANALALQGVSAYRNADGFQIPNRVSYFFDFHGPSLCLDTACSASGSAVYLACQSLRNGQCAVAIAGGINLFLHPSRFIQYSQMQMMSPTGQCSPFGAAANGTVFGEGVGALLLKPLATAERDGDHVYAVIKGCAVNSGGKTTGFTVPSPQAQAALVSRALREAQIDPRTITYVEAHGTGTPLGDPIEIRGLSLAFEQNYGAFEHTNARDQAYAQFCAIGSVKANIGHLEAGAAIPGIIKIAMQMKHGILVPSLNARDPNPSIPFASSPFRVPQEVQAWERPTITEAGRVTTYPRRAGISSFGAGGSNAHVILEEYIPRTVPGAGEARPELVVLSAQKRETLRGYVTRLAAFLRRGLLESSASEASGPLRLTDIAFTLRIGREQMDERLALVVNTVSDLIEKLSSWAALSAEEIAGSGSSLANVYWGRATAEKSRSGGPMAAADRQALVPASIEKRRLVELAQLWVDGLTFDWSSLPSLVDPADAPQRVPLPGYSFAGDRFWLPGEPNLKLAQLRDALEGAGHPLLDGIAPNLSLGTGIVFTKRLTAHQPLLRDHVVRGQVLLPGAGFLEMVCAALKRTGMQTPYRLANVVWCQPLVIEQEPKEILISIKAEKPGGVSFEVLSQDAAGGPVCTTGSARAYERDGGSELETLAVDSVQARCPRALDREAIYRHFRAIGVDYGPYFRSIEHAHLSESEALSFVRLPTSIQREVEQYLLHPAVLDAGLQTALLLTQDQVTALPFSAEALEVVRPLGAVAYAHAKRIAHQRFEVSVLDESGAVCARFRDLCLRALRDPVDRLLYTPRWKPCPLPRPENAALEREAAHVLIIHPSQHVALADALAVHHAGANVYRVVQGAKSARLDERRWEIATSDPQAWAECFAALAKIDRIYFLGGIRTESADIDDLEALRLSQELGARSLFRMLKSLHKRGLGEQSVDLFIITNDVCRVPPQATTQPQAAALLGLGRVIAKEFPRLQVRCLDISLDGVGSIASELNTQTLLASLLAEPAMSGSAVAIRDGHRYVQTLEPTRISAASVPPFKQKGVYFVLGGAGGLGFEFSRHLAETVQARLIWVGRGALDVNKRTKITQIESRGGEVLYVQADATDLASMREAVDQAKRRFGGIQGAVHSAIVLSDRTLANMNEGEFDAAFAPKVIGSAVLYKVLKDEPLDFMLFFSSANSFMAAMGQGNYVAGCCFKDALGRHLNDIARFPSKVINWGYWGTTGIVSGEDYQRRITAQGHLSIDPREGMDAISRILSAPFEQVAAVKAQDEALVQMGVDLAAQVELYPQEIPSLVTELVRHEGEPALDHQCISRFRQGFERLEQLGRRGLVAALRRAGVLLEPGERYDPVKLRARLRISEEYFRLFDAVLDLLIGAGVLVRAGQEVLSTQALREPPFADQLHDFQRLARALAQEFPEVADRIPLLSACAESLLEILAGAKGHMEVMFPGGSLALVEKIYTGNVITQYFNRRLAGLVADYVRRRLAADSTAPIRILEVGAGTGASSGHVLEAVSEFGSRVRYLYTDISRSFLQHGEQAYAGRYAFAKFKRLDLEEDAEAQGVERGSIDLAFGTNCVHATRNITATLHRIKRTLKTNGVLLLNEFTERLDYNTLTFGLTSGWWLFEDDAFRIKGAPLLDQGQWRHVLLGSGFRNVQFLDAGNVAAKDVGQCLIIAESDGRAMFEQANPVDAQGVAAKTRREDNVATRSNTDIATPDSSLPKNTATTPEMHLGDEQLRDRTLSYIKSVFSEVTKIAPSDMDRQSPFDRFGVDSLMALGITHRFEKDLGQLPATMLFQYPTLDALTEWFFGRYREILADRLGTGEARSKQQPDTTKPAATSKMETERPRVLRDESYQPVLDKPERNVASTFENEPIAIVGVAGRYPMADTPEQLWENLAAGRNCITEIPPGRWDAEAHYSGGSDSSGRSHSKWGGFISDVDKFDALFFNLSPKEAERMDPQERLFLETAWHTFESAGYTRRRLDAVQKRHAAGIGVFVGCMYQQYPFVASEQDTGALLSTASYWSIANRVSYFLNLNGPSLAVDSACSSSLTAIHLACQSIKRGECAMALAGGVNLNLHPSKYLRLQQLGMLASGAHSKSLGDGDGLVPGEGVGAVLLKPLSWAMQDSDIIHAVIRSSAINHGGRTSGFTVPSPNSQADLIASSLEKAGVDPRTITYLEVAANGSALGDAIEIAGLTAAFQRFTPERQFCAVGSVKSNLGHLEAASGIAQLTKVLLQLKHGWLVPSLHAEPLNPNLRLEETPFYVQQRASAWQRPWVSSQGELVEAPRRATVSSFGAGGSNAHVLVEEYPFPVMESAQEPTDSPQLVVLSARTDGSLKQDALSLLKFLQGKADAPLPSELAEKTLQDLERDLVTIIAAILHVPAGDVDLESDLGDCGFDAGNYALLANRLRDRYGIELSSRTLAASGTLKRITEYLLSNHEQAVQLNHGEDAQTMASARPARLRDVAYTLQIGREPMRERLAMVVSSTEDLVARLDAYCTGIAPVENLHRARASASTASLIVDGLEGKQYLDSVVRNRKLSKLAQLWVSGVEIDWEQLHSGAGNPPRRVVLPTYHFEKRRHWIADVPAVGSAKRVAPLPGGGQAPPHRHSPVGKRESAETLRELDARTPERAGHEGLERLKRDIGSLVATLLEVDEREIDFDEELRAYGFDSINLASLAQGIAQKFDLDLTASVLFGYSSVAACAEGLWASNQDKLLQHCQDGPTRTVNTAEPVDALRSPEARTAPLTRAAVQALNSADQDDSSIAIIGISGRMPQSDSMDQFWAHLMAGRELITEIPKERWDWRKHYGDPHTSGNKTRVKWASFLTDVDQFDSLFFGISPREAESMDPRQRLLLETVWSTIENAGYSPSAFAGSRTGLFIGVGNNDYSEMLRAARVELTAHASTGLMVNSILTSRVSYLLDLRGPSEILDTACSSSTVALHRAIRAIRSGECDAAIAGGVNVLLDPQGFVMLDKAGVLSADGKVRLFSEGATGYVRGEGVGAVLLKRTRQAVADRDHIYAIVKGSAVNHDGKSYSLTAPNPRAQAEAVLAAYREAAVDPTSVSYIEAQGTGSPLADPVEVEAFKVAFEALYREWGIARNGPVCGIGYLKPNIGHLECASGITALLKLLWALKKREIPGTKNVDEQAARRHLKDSPFYIVSNNQPWLPKVDQEGRSAPRRAGLHSFGFGGVNAHVVLEEYTRYAERSA